MRLRLTISGVPGIREPKLFPPARYVSWLTTVGWLPLKYGLPPGYGFARSGTAKVLVQGAVGDQQHAAVVDEVDGPAVREAGLVLEAQLAGEALLLALFVVLLVNWSVPLALAGFVGAYFLEILVDNSTSRAKWQLVLQSTWAVTLVLAGGNVLALFLLRS